MATNAELLAALESSMASMDDSVPAVRGIVYGESGTGKTVITMMLAQAICPPDKRILYVDYAEGFATLKASRWKHLTKRTDRMRYQGITQISTVADMYDDPNEAVNGRFRQYGVVVLDESSAMANQSLLTIVKARAAKDATKDPDTPTQPDMNASTNRVYSSVAALYRAPWHVLQIAHIRKDKDNLNIEVTAPGFMPALGGKLRQDALFVAFVKCDEKETDTGTEYTRTIQVHPTRRIVAKSRIDGLDVTISPDTFIEAVREFTSGTRAEVDELPPQMDIEFNTDDEDSDAPILVD